MTANRVYVRGCGLVSALGETQREIADLCRAGTVRPTRLRLPHSCDHVLPYYAVPGTAAGESSEFLYRHIDEAVDRAVRDAELDPDERARLGVFVGSTAGDISDLESRYRRDLTHGGPAFPLYRSGFGVLAGHVADRLGSGGREFTFNTACSSSANAVLAAARMIARGRLDDAVVVGAEVRNQMSLQGFNVMMLLSPEGCRPFDKRRNGTVLGEGVGAVVLSRSPPRASQFRGPRPFHWAGGANLVDPANVASSSAEMIAAVMCRALQDAGRKPDDIAVVKAHGTGTIANDRAEAEGMRSLFGDDPPPFTSLKPYIGHTLGACGVMETIVTLACAADGFIPATAGFAVPDEACGCRPLTAPLPFAGGDVLLNYFGFGGNNSSLLISDRP